MGLKRVWDQLRQCQSVELKDSETNKNGLDRCLNKFDLIAYGLGSTIGAGVFVSTGDIAAFHSGPAVCISYLCAGFAALLSGLCYGEFAARIPIAGSAYSYSYASLGELMGWVMGWNLCLEYGIAAGTIASSWSGYVLAMFSNFGLVLKFPFEPLPIGDTLLQINFLGLFIILSVTCVQLIGCETSARFNLIMTVFNVCLITFVIIYGLILTDRDNWSPFMPFGINEMLVGAGVAFFSYIGFDCVSSMAAESRNPKVDVPFSLMGCLSIVSVLYVLIGLAITGMVPYTTLQLDEYHSSPISQAFKYAGSDWAASMVAVGSVTTLTCTTLCSMLGQPRILLAMAQDGLLPSVFGKLNSRQVPYAGTYFTAVVAGLLAFFFTFDFLADSVSLGTFMAFSFVCAGVLILRLCYDPERVDASTQPGKRIISSNVSMVVIAWYGIGTWFFWFMARSVGVSMAAYIPLGIVASLVPLGLILYQWYCGVIAPPGRNFTTPLMPYVPLLGLHVNGCLMSGLSFQSYTNLAIWTGLGLLVYIFYGFSHSKLRLIKEGKLDDPTIIPDDAAVTGTGIAFDSIKDMDNKKNDV